MDLDDDAWTVVKNTPGVTGFVGAAGKPIPLSQPEVDRILRTGAATAERARAQVEYSLGEVKDEGETATAKVTMKFSNVPEEYKDLLPASVPATMELKQEGGDWCVSRLVPQT